jgi:hypothetical protein
MLGTPLQLHGQLLTAPERPGGQFVEQLRSALPIATKPLPATSLVDRVAPQLWSASHIYIRRRGVLLPLGPLYVGSYAVTGWADKFFTV